MILLFIPCFIYLFIYLAMIYYLVDFYLQEMLLSLKQRTQLSA